MVPSSARSVPSEQLLRIGGVSSVLGAIITPPLLITRPHTDPYAPIEKTLQTYAENQAAFDLHAFGVAIGFLLLLGGYVGLHESLRGEPEAVIWSWLGLVFGILVTTFAMVFIILDAPVMSRLAQGWAEAPAEEKAAALHAAEGLYTLDTVMIAPLHTGLFFTFLFFGLAVWRSDIFHRWLGRVGVGLSIIGVLVGFLAIRQGVPTEPAQMRDGVVLILLFAWFILVGVTIWRSSTSPASGLFQS